MDLKYDVFTNVFIDEQTLSGFKHMVACDVSAAFDKMNDISYKMEIYFNDRKKRYMVSEDPHQLKMNGPSGTRVLEKNEFGRLIPGDDDSQDDIKLTVELLAFRTMFKHIWDSGILDRANNRVTIYADSEAEYVGVETA
jgi:hypothetical protein